jgi:hypothetical protein
MRPDPDDAYAVRRAHAWRASHPHVAEDPLAGFVAGWQEGSWRTLRSNTDLALMLNDIVGRLETIAHRLRTAEIDAELEAQSVYWKTDESS